MKKIVLGGVALITLFSLGIFYFAQESEVSIKQDGLTQEFSYTETEMGFDAEPVAFDLSDVRVGPGFQYSLEELKNWRRTEGPMRVGLQVGHWQNENMPEELKNLELNGGGASWAGLSEREVVLEISKMVQEKLQAEGVLVDLLPATVPKGYLADAFVSIHADGNTNAGVNGYKIAPPRRDYTGLSEALSAAIYETYGLATGLRTDPSVTRRMTAYYAFNWPRYEYAIHPMTPAVIVETGFLTSSVDREIIVNQPERAAVGITDGIMAFLNNSAKDLVPAPLEFTRPNLPISGVVRCAPLRAERLSRALEYDCLPSLTSKEGQNYLIEGYASSTLPVGTEIVVMGNYRAIQTAYNYFWFPYEVTGIITDSVIEFIEG